ncbi:MAG TPA: class I adenylate-forming enzyme family protein [Rhizomicrobium sp.]|nr:class I adenylate-forming enzyme family protein [Rhizomicrobium sp.]
MNDRHKNWPALSLQEAHARLTAPGGAFETAEIAVRGVPMRVWKHVPATAAQAFARARKHGTREFLVYQGERVSYEGFARASLAIANLLVERGLKKGDRVALVMRNLPEWPVVFLGALLAGAIVVPLNAWWSGPELAFGILDSGAHFVFADAERLPRLQNPPPLVEQLFVTRAANPPAGVTVLEEIIGAPSHWQDLPEAPMPNVSLAPEDDATIFYTSGTTGVPKGALGTHRSLTTNIFAMPFSNARNELRRGPPSGLRIASAATATSPSCAAREGEGGPEQQRVTLLAVPFFHVIGSLSVLLPNMVAGGKLILMRKFEAREALDLIAREQVTVTGGVPAVALALLEEAGGNDDLSSLRLVTYGGAPSPATLPRRIRDRLGALPGQGWGMTETSATCTTHSGEDYLHRPSSCGPALPVSRIKIMKDGIEQPPGTAGELWAFGPNIVKGYWNRPEASAEVFQSGWVKTGDLAMLDHEGFCTILDRAQDMLIRGGENIYCAEVENVLAQHPAVIDAALVGLPHPLLGEVPAALVQTRAGTALSEKALQDFAARQLAAFKVPVKVHLSQAALPRNDGGKLMKSGLHKVFRA